MSVSKKPRCVYDRLCHQVIYLLLLQTKKKRPSRRNPVADNEDQMQVDENTIIPRQRDLDANFVDDYELQAALARSRKAKLHQGKAKKLSPEELAKKSN
jgi:U4/U6.U5 tri-snRNP-associated protein 1